ncbi:MAG: sigma-70 family RNA polymerase sigma factor [Bacilli bacterium]|nr:sigma-70 family RNA polymerase sigma factor [Bacilli bacterium]
MYAPFVLKIAKQLVSDPLEAEDICHDIFLEVFEKPGEYDDAKGTVKAWLAVKTKHRSIDRLRKKKPVLVRKLEQLDTKEAVKTELEVLKSLEKNVLLEALAHLPEKQREVIYGAYFENKTQTELARTLNKPLGTIKSNVRYGLNNLRKYKKLRQWFA